MELNWLPDYVAVAEIAGSIGSVMSTDEAASAPRLSPGLIPTAIDPDDETIVWADVGKNDLDEQIADLQLMRDEFRYYSKDRAQAKSSFDNERDQDAKMPRC